MHVEKSWCGPNIDSLAIGNNLLQHIIRDMHNVMHSRHAAFHFQVYDKERERGQSYYRIIYMYI